MSSVDLVRLAIKLINNDNKNSLVMVKILEVLNKVKVIVDIAIPIIEVAMKKDLNNDGKIG